jgi:hypothetical protein
LTGHVVVGVVSLEGLLLELGNRVNAEANDVVRSNALFEEAAPRGRIGFNTRFSQGGATRKLSVLHCQGPFQPKRRE